MIRAPTIEELAGLSELVLGPKPYGVTHWRGAQPADCGRAARLHVVSNGGARPQRAGKAIHWLQEPIRRAAAAMRESRSNDLLILARVALQAAIPSEDDPFALLKDTTTPPAFPPPVELALA